MTKDDALIQARTLLQTALAASDAGKLLHETINQHDRRMLSDHIGDFLREMQNGFDDEY